jgi:predicted nucleic acid-binding protein
VIASGAPRYLLDTTALIDFSKGFEPARSKLLALLSQPVEIAVCCVTIAEFFAGVEPETYTGWREFFSTLTYWNISDDAAAQAGAWRYEYRRQGIQLSTADALVAATAWEHAAVLITNNGKHYPMPGIELMSARD